MGSSRLDDKAHVKCLVVANTFLNIGADARKPILAENPINIFEIYILLVATYCFL